MFGIMVLLSAAVPVASVANAATVVRVIPVNTFTKVYDDRGTGANADVSIWRPDTSAHPGYRSVGDVVMTGHSRPPANAFLVAEEVLARPAGFRLVWTDRGSGGDLDISLWQPIAPSGYRCLGSVAALGYSAPSTDVVRCVQNEHTLPGRPVKVWDDSGSGADADVGLWQSDPSNHFGLPMSTFVARPSHTASGDASLYAVLDKRHIDVALFSGSPVEESTARSLAPLVRLHPSEVFHPSTVEHFLLNTHEESGHLTTNQPLGCDSCAAPPFLSGQRPDSLAVNAYALILPRTQQGRPTPVTDVVYWFFYPYNRGKRVCLGIELSGTCIGGWSTFGNHVGDWEHVTVRLRDNVPAEVFFSQHSGGRSFVYGDKNVSLANWAPVVYSALGSHGSYPLQGRHVYRSLPNGGALYDETAAGMRWDTKTHLVTYRWQPPGTHQRQLAWLDIRSRWGNAKSGCAVVEPIAGECVLNAGPEGPASRVFAQPELSPLG